MQGATIPRIPVDAGDGRDSGGIDTQRTVCRNETIRNAMFVPVAESGRTSRSQIAFTSKTAEQQ